MNNCTVPERDSIMQGRVRRYKASVDTSDFVNGLNATNLSPARWSRRRSRCRTLRIPGVRCPRCSAAPPTPTAHASNGRPLCGSPPDDAGSEISTFRERTEYCAPARRMSTELQACLASASISRVVHEQLSRGTQRTQHVLRWDRGLPDADEGRTYACEPFLHCLPG
jgi:hypothetical protein